jgi:hypothetical protein
MLAGDFPAASTRWRSTDRPSATKSIGDDPESSPIGEISGLENATESPSAIKPIDDNPESSLIRGGRH